jgi:copper chaperone CopZ
MKTEGVVRAEVSFERGEAVVKYDDRKVTVARLREAINAAGFKAEGIVPTKSPGGRRKGG